MVKQQGYMLAQIVTEINAPDLAAGDVWACEATHWRDGLAGVAPRHIYQQGLTTERVVLRTSWPQPAQGRAARRPAVRR